MCLTAFTSPSAEVAIIPMIDCYLPRAGPAKLRASWTADNSKPGVGYLLLLTWLLVSWQPLQWNSHQRIIKDALPRPELKISIVNVLTFCWVLVRIFVLNITTLNFRILEASRIEVPLYAKKLHLTQITILYVSWQEQQITYAIYH